MHIRALVILVVVLLIVPSILAATPAVRHKGIVPIVGTTATFGTAQQPGFHSTVTLYGKQSTHGRLVFHPAGQVANDDTDPSYPTRAGFTPASRDVGGILGKGPFIGSMDIIPDPAATRPFRLPSPTFTTTRPFRARRRWFPSVPMFRA